MKNLKTFEGYSQEDFNISKDTLKKMNKLVLLVAEVNGLADSIYEDISGMELEHEEALVPFLHTDDNSDTIEQLRDEIVEYVK
jgi:hypothetical protein